jgi:TonB family protein
MSKYLAIAATLVVAALLVVRAQAPEDAASLIKSAQEAVRHANYADADVLYAKAAALGDTPQIAPALIYLGVRALGSNNRLAAEGFFERILKIDPKGPQAGPAMSWLATMRTDDPVGAEELYKQALDVENQTSLEATETLRKYSVLLRRQGRLEEAAALEQRAREAQLGTNGAVQTKLDMPEGVYRVGSGVTAPSLASKVEPQYTEDARAGKIQGVTQLVVDIGPDGIARNIQVTRSLEPGLDLKAIEAVQQWRFKPGTKDGAPVTVRASIEVNFRLM